MDEFDALRLSRLRHLTESGRARQLRQQARLSVAEVARACNVAHTTLTYWEQSQRRPHGPAALRYAAFLDALAADELARAVPA